MPKMATLIDDVVFDDIWARPELSPRDRSLVTIAGLVAAGDTRQLRGHLRRALNNGVTATELKEVMLHMAFYAGWPKALSSVAIAKEVLTDEAS